MNKKTNSAPESNYVPYIPLRTPKNGIGGKDLVTAHFNLKMVTFVVEMRFGRDRSRDFVQLRNPKGKYEKRVPSRPRISIKVRKVMEMTKLKNQLVDVAMLLQVPRAHSG